MSCNQPILTPVNAPTYIGLNQTALLRAYSQAPRRLMVSDNPEKVSGNPAVLWKHTQPVVQDVTQYTHRVFMWHVNDGTTTKKIGLTIENLGTATLTVEGSRETRNGTSGFDIIGRCLAGATLGNTQDPLPGGTITVTSGVGLIEEFTNWVHNELRGAIYHLTISAFGTGTVGCRLRTVFGFEDTDLTTLTGNPVSPSGVHSRGSWVDSDIVATFQIDIINVNIRVYFYLSQGAYPASDFLFRADNSVDQVAVDNKGNFGVTYDPVRLTIGNTTDVDQTVFVYLNPRGGNYVGAVTQLDSSTVYRIGPIRTDKAIHLGTVTIPPRSSVITEFRLMTGGDSYLPVAIILSSDAF